MFVFSGKDSFAAYSAARECAQQLSNSTHKEIIILNDEDVSDPQELMLRLDSVSLFTSGEIVLLKRPLSSPKFQRFISDKLDKLKDLDLVIWQDSDLDKRLTFTKELQKLRIWKEFSEPEDNEIISWVMSEAEKVKISRSDAAHMIERLGKDKWLLKNELVKLQLFTEATGEAVTTSMIDNITGSNVTGDIWKFLDSLTQGSKLAALQELEKMMAFEDMTQYIMTMLNRELTLLAQVKAASNPQTLKMSPFVLKKTIAKAHKFSWQKLQTLARALMRLDNAIKSGKVEGKIGLSFAIE